MLVVVGTIVLVGVDFGRFGRLGCGRYGNSGRTGSSLGYVGGSVGLDGGGGSMMWYSLWVLVFGLVVVVGCSESALFVFEFRVLMIDEGLFRGLCMDVLFGVYFGI